MDCGGICRRDSSICGCGWARERQGAQRRSVDTWEEWVDAERIVKGRPGERCLGHQSRGGTRISIGAFAGRQVDGVSKVLLSSSATKEQEESSKGKDECESANNSTNDRCVANGFGSFRSACRECRSACRRRKSNGA